MTKAIHYAETIIDISHEKLDHTFTYMIPDSLYPCIRIGSPVMVPFGAGNHIRKAYVIDILDELTPQMQEYKDQIKYIDSISEEVITVEKDLIDLAAWMKNRYGCTMTKALKTVLPVEYVSKHVVLREITIACDEDTFQGFYTEAHNKHKVAWIRLMDDLLANKKTDYQRATKDLKISTVALKAMESVGLIVIKSKDTYRQIENADTKDYNLHTLNEEQQQAVDTFTTDYDKGDYHTYLLYGITGSGKTDVYLNMIKHVIAQGKKAIVLIPEISLTYQTINRLRGVFGDRVAIIHSKLSAGERYDQFRRCRENDADIIVGPRSAIFAPFQNIGIIVIDEEHDKAYNNDYMPRYHTVDVAKYRLSHSSGSLVLSSATPSPESYQYALSGKYKMLKLSTRAHASATLPDIHVVDLREELKAGNRSIFSKLLYKKINEKLARQEQIILFMNRRGYSNFISCRSCGKPINCPHCDVTLTVHNNSKLMCHYCGYTIDVPKLCPSCGSPYISGFGMGTQKLETETKKMFPKARVERLDMDSARGKNSSMDILARFGEHKTDILIGTQMVVKGHDFPLVSLVGIMAADTSLYINSYDSAQRTYELLTQASGRAGRDNIKGDVIIQTYRPDHYAIVSCAHDDYDYYYNQEIAYRQLAMYPPCIHIWTVQISSKNEDILNEFCSGYNAVLQKANSEYKAAIIGPVEAEIYKVHDYYRKMLYIKHFDYDILLKIKDFLEKEYINIVDHKEISIMYDFI